MALEQSSRRTFTLLCRDSETGMHLCCCGLMPSVSIKGWSQRLFGNVRMMDKIYSRAQRVFIDLGDAGDEIECLIPFLEQFDVVPENYFSKKILGVLANLDLPKAEDPAWADYVQFMTRPWFSRVWTMQEFILAKEVVILAGMHRLGCEFLDWLVLAGLQYNKAKDTYHLACLAEGDELIKDFHESIEKPHGNLLLTMQYRRLRLDGRSDYQNFCNYLRTSNTFDATDKRDRAYASLALATDIDSSSFLVSYSESIDEVSMRVTRYLIKNDDGVYALYQSVGINDRRSSWAFDLAGDTPRDLLRYHVDGTGYSRVLRAQGDSKTCMRVHSDKSLLRVTGFIFGRIMNLTGTNTPGDIVDWILEVSRWTEDLRSHPLGPVEPMACWRATFLDCIIDSLGQACRFGESPEIEDDFAAFISSVNILRTHLGSNRIGKTIDSAFEPVLRKMMPMIKNINMLTGRRLACTTDGMVCLVPGNAQVGDHLSIFHGAPIPFVLRKQDDHFRIVDSAYIRDMMDGQAFESDKWQAEDIILR